MKAEKALSGRTAWNGVSCVMSASWAPLLQRKVLWQEHQRTLLHCRWRIVNDVVSTAVVSCVLLFVLFAVSVADGSCRMQAHFTRRRVATTLVD